MIFYCHSISQKRDQKLMGFYGLEFLMVSRHPAKFGGHRHYVIEDLIILVTEEEDSRCSCFNLAILFIFKGHGLKTHSISY